MKKWIFRTVLALAILLVISVAVVALFLDSIVEKGVETVGPRIAKVEMHLDGASISPLAGSCRLNKFVVGNPSGYKTPSAIEVGKVKLGVKISSLLSEVVQVDEINIQDPQITLEGGLGGNNLSQILDNLDSAASEDKTAEQTQSSNQPTKKFYVKQVVIEGGKINLSLTGMDGKAMSLPLPPIRLSELGTPEKGISAAVLSQAIMKSILTGTTKAAAESAGVIGKGFFKEVGTQAAEQANKAVQGVKNFFKKQ